MLQRQQFSVFGHRTGDLVVEGAVTSHDAVGEPPPQLCQIIERIAHRRQATGLRWLNWLPQLMGRPQKYVAVEIDDVTTTTASVPNAGISQLLTVAQCALMMAMQMRMSALPTSERPKTDYLSMWVATRFASMPISRSIPAGETYVPQK